MVTLMKLHISHSPLIHSEVYSILSYKSPWIQDGRQTATAVDYSWFIFSIILFKQNSRVKKIYIMMNRNIYVFISLFYFWNIVFEIDSKLQLKWTSGIFKFWLATPPPPSPVLSITLFAQKQMYTASTSKWFLNQSTNILPQNYFSKS